MVSEDPPLTKEEISELEKCLSEKLEKSRKKLTNEELEQAKKDFIERKKRKQEEKNEEETEEETGFDNLEKKSESSFFKDKNKFIESFNLSQNQNLENTDIIERNNLARSLEKQAGWNISPTSMTRQNQREEDNLKYSASNYDDSQEKKYTIENDVENHLVKTPKRPDKINTTHIGKENPTRQGFNKQVDFQSPYPENIDSESRIEKSYIKPEKRDFEQKRNENSFFQEDPREQKKKYKTR